MKLLLDENLSDRIVPQLGDLFPGSSHFKGSRPRPHRRRHHLGLRRRARLHRRLGAGGPGSSDGRLIALKTDPVWTRLSRFSRPWPPFDFGSGMGIEEIDREEAEARGLIAPGELLEPSAAREEQAIEASAKGLDPAIRASLQKHFGDQPAIEGDAVRWKRGKPPASADAANADLVTVIPAVPGEPGELLPETVDSAGSFETVPAPINANNPQLPTQTGAAH